MPFEDMRGNFEDIFESIEAIERFIDGMDFNAFSEDEKTQAAIERKLLIISEAAIRLNENAESMFPELPWRDIRGIGNWLRHQYDSIELETIWNTIHDDLPPLKATILKIVK